MASGRTSISPYRVISNYPQESRGYKRKPPKTTNQTASYALENWMGGNWSKVNIQPSLPIGLGIGGLVSPELRHPDSKALARPMASGYEYM